MTQTRLLADAGSLLEKSSRWTLELFQCVTKCIKILAQPSSPLSLQVHPPQTSRRKLARSPQPFTRWKTTAPVPGRRSLCTGSKSKVTQSPGQEQWSAAKQQYGVQQALVSAYCHAMESANPECAILIQGDSWQLQTSLLGDSSCPMGCTGMQAGNNLHRGPGVESTHLMDGDGGVDARSIELLALNIESPDRRAHTLHTIPSV